MDTGENSSGDEFEDAADVLNDDDEFLAMMDVPATKKPQTLSKAITGTLLSLVGFKSAI